MDLPSELTDASKQIWLQRFNNLPRPLIALSDENGDVFLIGDLTKNAISQSEIESVKDSEMKRWKGISPFMKILEHGVKETNGKKVGYFKYLDDTNLRRYFGYVFFIDVDGEALMFNFFCVEPLRKSWEKSIDQVVLSLKIN